MPFIQSTTPTIRIGLPLTTKDLTNHKLFATVSQDSYSVTKTGVTLTEDTTGKYKYIASFTLNQAQTAAFSYRLPVEIQLFWINSSNNKGGIIPIKDTVYKALNPESVTYA